MSGQIGWGKLDAPHKIAACSEITLELAIVIMEGIHPEVVIDSRIGLIGGHSDFTWVICVVVLPFDKTITVVGKGIESVGATENKV